MMIKACMHDEKILLDASWLLITQLYTMYINLDFGMQIEIDQFWNVTVTLKNIHFMHVKH